MSSQVEGWEQQRPSSRTSRVGSRNDEWGRNEKQDGDFVDPRLSWQLWQWHKVVPSNRWTTSSDIAIYGSNLDWSSLGSCIFMENWKFFCKETKAKKLFGCIRYDNIRAWSWETEILQQLQIWTSTVETKVRQAEFFVLLTEGKAWNSLPSNLQELKNTDTFKRLLKTQLFKLAFGEHKWLCWCTIGHCRCNWRIKWRNVM